MDTSLPHPAVSFLSVCVHTGEYKWPQRQGVSAGVPGWKLPSVGASTQTLVLCKNSKWSRPRSHVSAQGLWLFEPVECSGQESLHRSPLPPNAAIAGRWFSLVVSLLMGGLVFPLSCFWVISSNSILLPLLDFKLDLFLLYFWLFKDCNVRLLLSMDCNSRTLQYFTCNENLWNGNPPLAPLCFALQWSLFYFLVMNPWLFYSLCFKLSVTLLNF